MTQDTTMRFSSSSLLLFFAFGLSVEAMFRPIGHKPRPPPSSYHGGGDEDCDESSSAKPSTTTAAPVNDNPATTTTTEAPTTTTAAPKCPDGFTAFTRTPSAANSQTSIWCMKAVLQKDPIAVSSANALCAAQATGAVLTSFENDDERSVFAAELLAAVQSYGYSTGAIAVDGRRNADCVTRNRTVLDAYPCSNQSLSFSLVDAHTDPAYAWAHWAVDEPSTNMWTYDIEECIQFAVYPGNSNRNALLNDIYCNFVQAPNDPDNSLWWNFGALCGVAPQ
ncbi:unnamed protein product [Caenorhabditis sp. 36 PRJEB53466]|nr:unnamed protein product [Caenorhabditis sp. 36 PRJEB53466]